MGVRDTPSFSTSVSSAMRAPPGNSPASISSRRRSCALTAGEAPASAASAGGAMVRESDRFMAGDGLNSATRMYT